MPNQENVNFAVTRGFVSSETTPDTDQLYASIADIQTLYGIGVEESEIRFAMSLIHTVTNRPSLYPSVYEEMLTVADDRNQIILSARPVIKILSAAGRYDYGRRDRIRANRLGYDYFVAMAAIGSSPTQAAEINVDNIELFPATGECWLPNNLSLNAYQTVFIKYLTGFQQIPDRIFAAMIEIINTIQHKGVSDLRNRYVGKVQTVWQSSGFITETAYQLLSPYIVTALG